MIVALWMIGGALPKILHSRKITRITAELAVAFPALPTEEAWLVLLREAETFKMGIERDRIRLVSYRVELAELEREGLPAHVVRKPTIRDLGAGRGESAVILSRHFSEIGPIWHAYALQFQAIVRSSIYDLATIDALCDQFNHLSHRAIDEIEDAIPLIRDGVRRVVAI
ncbi:hypothetical protein ACIGO7_07670 [Streptomyces virginiae]|uniref:hypothetical protein n=1 Tax=Streptomyces virginiae TaxID=1961 RepID=UPI00344EC037